MEDCVVYFAFELSTNLMCTYYANQVTRQLLHSSVFMSLTWRDSLSVRRCAAIATAIIEKV